MSKNIFKKGQRLKGRDVERQRDKEAESQRGMRLAGRGGRRRNVKCKMNNVK